MKKLLIIGVVIVLAGAGAFFLTSSSDETSNSNTESSDSTTASDTPATQSTQQQATANTENATGTTITYTDEGFNPSKLTVKVGTTITVKNNSSKPLQFSSDPHPEHTDEDELNLGTTSPGGSETFVVSMSGTYGFHDHLNDEHTGTLVAE